MNEYQLKPSNAKRFFFLFPGSERWAINDKTIMLVGATGSGKSTLIDGFANYLFGVNWEDNFRFTLVDLEHEEERRLKDQVSLFHHIRYLFTFVLTLQFVLTQNIYD